MNSTIKLLSPTGGWSATDGLDTAPAHEGQIGISYPGNKVGHVFFGGSTLSGDWIHSFAFPTGIESIGSADFSSPSFQGLEIHINGNPMNWDAPGDGPVTIINSSRNPYSSGSLLNIAVMQDGFGLIDPVINEGGSGYAPGDLLCLDGGTLAGVPAIVRVTAVDGVERGAITAAIRHNSGEYVTPPTSPATVTQHVSSGTGATFTFTAKPKAVRALPHNSLSFGHSKSNNIEGLLPGYGMIVMNPHAVHNKGFTLCMPGLGGFNIGNGSWIFFELDGTVSIPKFVEHARTPSDTGYQHTLKANSHTGVVTIDNLEGAIITELKARITALENLQGCN